MVSSLKWMEKDKIDMKVRMLSIAMVLFLSGCAVTVRPKAVATSQEVLQNKRAQLMTKGNSIDFADGYIDGCSSGKRAIGEKRYQKILYDISFTVAIVAVGNVDIMNVGMRVLINCNKE